MDIYQETLNFYERVKTEKRIIGKSFFGRKIVAVKMGEGSPVGIVQYAMHGREFITAKLAQTHFNRGVYKGSVWLLPLVNPDGALLSQIGLSSVKRARDRKRLLVLNGGSENFSLWKANGRGVDLNVNFDARWGSGRKNTRVFGSENCIGENPFSETETQALKAFTEEIRPDFTVSYHTKGEEIYWYFYQSMRTCPKDKRFALVASKSTGYPLAYAKGSAGGYKDWCVEKFKIPSLTIEAGADIFTHPLGDEAWESLRDKNANLVFVLTKEFGLNE